MPYGGTNFMFTDGDIEEIFTYHTPTADQIPLYVDVRASARAFAHTILRCVPQSADQTAAIRLLRQCVMTCNSGIALRGKF
jgi:hypothetical protein